MVVCNYDEDWDTPDDWYVEYSKYFERWYEEYCDGLYDDETPLSYEEWEDKYIWDRIEQQRKEDEEMEREGRRIEYEQWLHSDWSDCAP